MNIDDQVKILTQGVVDLKPGGTDTLKTLLKDSQEKNKPLRVKLGIDPTSSDLHLGHMVCINKLRQFQDFGHQAVLLIGGYTAQVGDPSGRNEARPSLSADEVSDYAKTYIEQVAKVIDMDKVQIVNNADWFSKFSMTDMIKLAAKVTVNQMIAKDAFGKRLDAGQPLYAHEIIYPLLQGYDSVEIEADIELGGTDQLFNLMVGRDLQKSYDQRPQLAMTMPLLVGLDGVKKMSKSYQNYIGINDSANDIYGKTMSIPDELILDYFTLAAQALPNEVEAIKQKLNSGENPRNVKDELAQKIVSIYYSIEEGKQASENFINQFKKNEIPDDIPEMQVTTKVKVIDLLAETKLCASKGEAKRLIAGGGVKLAGEKVEDPNYEILPEHDAVLQVGKRKFVKLIP
jgi:tyrosyl-tRNA synthetase